MLILLKNPLAALFALLFFLAGCGWAFAAVELHFARSGLQQCHDREAVATAGNTALAAAAASQNQAVAALSQDAARRTEADSRTARLLRAHAQALLGDAAKLTAAPPPAAPALSVPALSATALSAPALSATAAVPAAAPASPCAEAAAANEAIAAYLKRRTP